MTIQSPCTSVCRMNPATGYCEGCFRTIPEITDWSRADDARKRAILAEVAGRRAAADLFEGGLRGECVSDG
ncbi:DUF1289 domain-containing protein [Zoogloea sp.]|uniref:DUF1289 domain-containing protein n=1 Tax=Zoogloea sp. TaxID=49181 RepID=UPI0035B14218